MIHYPMWGSPSVLWTLSTASTAWRLTKVHVKILRMNLILLFTAVSFWLIFPPLAHLSYVSTNNKPTPLHLPLWHPHSHSFLSSATCLFTEISILFDFPPPVLITTSLHYSSLHSHQKQVILFSLEQLFLTQLIPYEISVTSALSDVVSLCSSGSLQSLSWQRFVFSDFPQSFLGLQPFSQVAF